MKTVYRRASQSLIPPYSENGGLQLIIATGVTFIAFHFARIIMLIAGTDKAEVFQLMFPNFGMSSLELFQHKWWTIFTYGWVHHGFLDWVANMIWAYTFASVLQSLAGHRQVIPLFVYALLVGGVFFMGSQYLDASLFKARGNYFFGAHAGVIAIGFAAFVMAPSYRLHFTPTFSVPLALVLGIYVLLDILVFLPNQGNSLMLCAGGMLTGSLFGFALRRGYRPAGWIYDFFDKMEEMATPNEAALSRKKNRKRVEVLRTMYEPKRGISQERIDDILDKINEHGYQTLSREEKDILFRASKD